MLNKKDCSILIANILDKIDTSLYSFLAPILGPLFFPHHDPTVQLIMTYATSSVSLIARPVGTFLFGMFAYQHSPMISLSYSLMGVAFMTMIIGCIPGHALLGWKAPFLLVIARLMRGICAAGESTVAKLYILEDKIEKKALHASYWYQSSSMAGIVIASGIATVVLSVNPNWWRFCFMLSGITGLYAWNLRTSGVDYNTSKKLIPYKGFTYASLSLLWKHKVNVVRVALVTIFSHMTYAVPFVFLNTFVPLVTHITLQEMMQLNTVLLIFDMVIVPIVGYYTMSYQQKLIMSVASGLLSLSIIPLFYFLPNASPVYIIFVRIWIVIWGVLFLCPLNAWCRRLFSDNNAYFLVGMGNALGVATLGHNTTAICLWLWYMTGVVWVPAVYMMIVMIVTTGAILSVDSVVK